MNAHTFSILLALIAWSMVYLRLHDLMTLEIAFSWINLEWQSKHARRIEFASYITLAIISVLFILFLVSGISDTVIALGR